MSAYDTVVAGMSGAGLALIGFVTTSGTSDFHMNAGQMEAALLANAEAALAEAGQDWASVEMRGQRAFITGAPPSEEAAEIVKNRVYTSSGRGGLIWGGVIGIETEFSDIPDLPTMTPYVWRAIKSPNGQMTLVGSAPDVEISNALASYAASDTGAVVDNRVKPALGVPDGDWAGIARFGMDQLSLLDSGEARLTDLELRLSGVAMEDAARIQAVAAVSGLADPWSGVADISGPSLWKAEHVGDRLVLSGSCETEADKTEISNIAAEYFDGVVVDQMTVSSSEYEDWVNGVRLGLPHFTQFKNGEMAFEPLDDGFSFEGEATSSTLQFLREDMATLEGPYAVEIAAETVAVELDEIAGVDLGADPLIACQMSFDLVMNANAVVFRTGSAEISRESGLTLDKIMAVSETCSGDLLFELGGHTDNTGSRAANVVLSEARAQAVANYMQAAGFETARLIVKGYGPDQPKLDNATPEGRAANRRLEFTVQEWSE